MQRYLFIFLVLLAASEAAFALTDQERVDYYSAAPDDWAQLDNLEPLPGWRYEPMVEGLRADLKRANKVKNLQVRLLAWSTQEDDRPLLVDSVVLWASFESRDGKRWALSHRYRHPRAFREWWDATPTDVDWSDTIVLTHAPRNADVYALLDPERHLHSFFGAFGPDYTLHTAGVREKTWLSVLGEPPTEFFK